MLKSQYDCFNEHYWTLQICAYFFIHNKNDINQPVYQTVQCAELKMFITLLKKYVNYQHIFVFTCLIILMTKRFC